MQAARSGLPARAQADPVRLCRGFVSAGRGRGVPVLVVERGACERWSPAGHGWSAEWAWKDVSETCATLAAAETPENPRDSRGFLVVPPGESPPNDEESPKLCRCYGRAHRAAAAQAGTSPRPGSTKDDSQVHRARSAPRGSACRRAQSMALRETCPTCPASPGARCRDPHARKTRLPTTELHFARGWRARRCPNLSPPNLGKGALPRAVAAQHAPTAHGCTGIVSAGDVENVRLMGPIQTSIAEPSVGAESLTYPTIKPKAIVHPRARKNAIIWAPAIAVMLPP